jgi:hypothetical protein
MKEQNLGTDLMCVPIRGLRQSFIDTIIEVFVVREDDMTANIEQLGGGSPCEKSGYSFGRCGTHESLRSNISRCETARRFVRVDNEPRRFVLKTTRIC